MPASKATQATPQVDPGMWGVKDLTANGRARVHTPVVGHDYQMSSSGYTKMPQEHAIVFLRDPGFEVIDEDGEIVPAMARNAVDRVGEDRLKLAEGEVVANVDELTDTALRARASQKPGGRKLKKNATRKELIEFLLERNEPPEVVKDTAGKGDDDDMDEGLGSKMIDLEGN